MRIPQSGLRVDSPSFVLLQALLSFWGTTDAVGNVGGTTIRCGALTLEPSYANHTLKILSGPAAGQTRDITTHPAGTDTITVSDAFTNVAGAAQQITAGTLFTVLSSTPTVAEVAAVLAAIAALQADVGDASTSVLGSIWGILGNPAVDLATSIAAILAAIGAIDAGLQEQADVPFNVNAALVEANIFDLSVANTRYVVRGLRLKCVDPGAETVTVRLYELVNNVPTLVDTFAITTANFATYHSLMDMFGLPHLAGDNLKVAVIATAAGPFAVTGQYCTATATI